MSSLLSDLQSIQPTAAKKSNTTISTKKKKQPATPSEKVGAASPAWHPKQHSTMLLISMRVLQIFITTVMPITTIMLLLIFTLPLVLLNIIIIVITITNNDNNNNHHLPVASSARVEAPVPTASSF
jgi:hypothetical protein